MKLSSTFTAVLTLLSALSLGSSSDAAVVFIVDLDRDTDGIQDVLEVGPNFQGRGTVIIELTDDGAPDVGFTGVQFDLNFSGEVALGEETFTFQPGGFPPPPVENRAFQRVAFQSSRGEDFSSLGSITASDDGLRGFAAGAVDGADFQFNGFSAPVLDFNYSVAAAESGTLNDISFSNAAALAALDADMNGSVDPRTDFIFRGGTFNLTAVPEPSSMAVFSLGLGLVAWRRRRV